MLKSLCIHVTKTRYSLDFKRRVVRSLLGHLEMYKRICNSL